MINVFSIHRQYFHMTCPLVSHHLKNSGVRPYFSNTWYKTVNSQISITSFNANKTFNKSSSSPSNVFLFKTIDFVLKPVIVVKKMIRLSVIYPRPRWIEWYRFRAGLYLRAINALNSSRRQILQHLKRILQKCVKSHVCLILQIRLIYCIMWLLILTYFIHISSFFLESLRIH